MFEMNNDVYLDQDAFLKVCPIRPDHHRCFAGPVNVKREVNRQFCVLK